MPTRSLVLGCALLSGLAAGACKTEELHPPDPIFSDPNRWTGSFDPIHRNVDVLFLIDDSSGMAPAQDNLIRNFPTFMATLQADPANLPNIRIGVVSPDMGAGDGSVQGCDSTGGKQGILQYTARGTCSTSNLDPGATFISNIPGYPNYTGNIEDVFGCIAALGESGCGFQHPFAAIERALGVDDWSQPPAENQGFLRADAVLAIVMLTNQDDCSVSLGNGPNGRLPLFDTASNMNMASQLGPLTHFRCNEFGHLCSRSGGAMARPDRNAPGENVNALVTYDQCASNDKDAVLLSTEDTANRIKSLKADPSRVVVASIQGPPTPYAVHWNNPSTMDTSCGSASCPWPGITHTCTASDGRVGDPGVRTAQFAQWFGTNGAQMSVCDDSFGPGLEHVATMINRLLGPACLSGPVATNSVGEPDCIVAQNVYGYDGNTSLAHVPSCVESGGTAPCWKLETTASCPGQALDVSPDPSASGFGTFYRYSCAK